MTGFAAAVWWLTFNAALDQLEERGQADLSLAADRLTGQLQRVRDLAVLLSDHPGLMPLALAQGGDTNGADQLLQHYADRTGAERLWFSDAQGKVIAASDGEIGQNISGSPAFERALDGALGSDHGIDPVNGLRLYRFAAPVFTPYGPVAGAVVTVVAMEALEWNWPSDPSPVFFTDMGGNVFVTNRSDLILTRLGPQGDFPVREAWQVGGHDLWAMSGSPYLPRRALHLTKELPVIGLNAEILVNLTPALRLATLQAVVAAALCLAFGAVLFYFSERRRALAEQLDAEERVNAELEARVEERTEELSALNEDLRREIGERLEAEAALKQAQADLVQAGKLSALGQMSAGISHELNQPLMAIRSFAENGAILIERGQVEKAGESLSRISEMAQRMGRIIRNLRAFARQESEPAGRVGLASVVENAIEMLGPRIAQTGTQIDWMRPETTTVVKGGEVRLVQVIVNLMSNAMDAMAGSEDKRITLRVDRDPSRGVVSLSVRDTGPGIVEPDRIFDPFYTTKEVGGEGMGLGLSISYGLVQGFGGKLTGANADDGGAVFTLELEEAREVA